MSLRRTSAFRAVPFPLHIFVLLIEVPDRGERNAAVCLCRSNHGHDLVNDVTPVSFDAPERCAFSRNAARLPLHEVAIAAMVI